jgi:hypothetical protein
VSRSTLCLVAPLGALEDGGMPARMWDAGPEDEREGDSL